MFKNVKLKRVLKSTVFPVLSGVNKLIPKNDNYVMLYSPNMGIRHNLIPIKRYLLENGYDKKYRILCAIEAMDYKDDDEDRVEYISVPRAMLMFFRTKHVFYTTGQVPIKPSKQQVVIHLDHGTASLKTGNLLSKINNGDDFYFTYYTIPSEIYIPVVMKEFNCREENVVVNGEPVYDQMLKCKEQCNETNEQKIGLWAPTFRQSDYLGYDDSKEALLPTLTAEDYAELNEVLKKNGLKLIAKLHPGQNLDDYDCLHFSNLDIYSDKDFLNAGYELYDLMAHVDYLIGDYSSVPLQFLLMDKPIGYAIPDYEEYKEKRGFIFDNAKDYMPGPVINNKSELYSFLEDISKGVDNYKAERKAVCDKIHKYRDAGNCKRALQLSGISL